LDRILNYKVLAIIKINMKNCCYYLLNELFLIHIYKNNYNIYQIAMDNLSPRERSAQMAKVRSKNTKPEMTVRKLIYSLGYRYRLHRKELPGKPDIVFVSRKKVIFVNGCFWHGHHCSLGRIPKSRVDFWVNKINGNNKRDKTNIRKLKRLGWKVLVLWECQLKSNEKMILKIRKFLD